MAQQIQELIDQIKSEGVQQAELKAQQIISDAESKASGIIQKAQAEAKQLKAAAEADNKKLKDATTVALQQSCRNMLLSLRKDIQHIFKRILSEDVKGALDSGRVGALIEATIKEFLAHGQVDGKIIVQLPAADVKALKDGALAKIQKKFKEPVEFKPSDEVSKGFVVSFDGGKSSLDFTDESLADYLSAYLNEDIQDILNGAVKGS